MRAIVAVVLAFVAMSAATFALSLLPWFVFGVDGVCEPGRFDTTTAYDAWAIAAAIGGGVFGGWMCATVGRSGAAIRVLAVLGFCAGLGNHFVHHHKPDPGARPAGLTVMDVVSQRKEPDWYTLTIAFAGVPAILLGGRRRR